MDASWHGRAGVEKGCCYKPGPVFMEAEQEERPSDPGVQQVTPQHYQVVDAAEITPFIQITDN